MSTIYYTEFDTPLGLLLLRGTSAGLTGLFMETHRHGPAEGQRAGWQKDPLPFAQALAELNEYFAGKRTTFSLPIDRTAIGGTLFQQAVWSALEAIPYGATISYGELASRIANPKAVRAVGLANGRNPISIIVPCHRVIGANGSQTGYGGGMARKQWLLSHERSAHAGFLRLPPPPFSPAAAA